MKISIDGGALCSPSHKRFGTYSFTTDLLEALSRYDKNNTYYLYSYCSKPKTVYFARNIMFCRIRPKTLWMKFRVPIEEFIKRPNIFLALNQATPLFTKSAVIAFSHGASFIRKPEFYRYSSIKLKSQMNFTMSRSRFVIVSSTIVADELAKAYPRFKDKIRIIPFGLSEEFQKPVVRSRHPYFLFVGMNHRVKNVPFLLKAFSEFVNDSQFSRYNLRLIGPFSHLNVPKNVQVIPFLSRNELIEQYQNATGYLTASHYESFNYPVLEALSQNCPVVGLSSAIIPEMKKYTNIASDQESFLYLMKKAGRNELTPINTTRLMSEFSWERYVRSLLQLYKEV